MLCADNIYKYIHNYSTIPAVTVEPNGGLNIGNIAYIQLSVDRSEYVDLMPGGTPISRVTMKSVLFFWFTSAHFAPWEHPVLDAAPFQPSCKQSAEIGEQKNEIA